MSGTITAITFEESALVCAPYKAEGVVLTTIGSVPVYPERHENKFWAFVRLANLVGHEHMLNFVNTRLLKTLW